MSLLASLEALIPTAVGFVENETPKITVGANELIALLNEVKQGAQAIQTAAPEAAAWTEQHAAAVDALVTIATPAPTPAPEPPPAATPSTSEVASALAQSTTFPPTGGLAGIICAFLLLFAGSSMAQSVTSIENLIPPVAGQTITINGQTFLLTFTNGNYTAASTGVNGTVSVTTPTSAAEALSSIQAIVQANNPAQASFYSPTEIEAKLGGVYEQNSGAAAALISVTKWQPVFNQPLGFEAALLQGNQNGSSGTAAAYGAVDYRKVIGSVAAIGGVGVGYDNYNARIFGLVKGGVELRQGNHLGEWVDLSYAAEAKGNASRGFGFASGVSYSF